MKQTVNIIQEKTKNIVVEPIKLTKKIVPEIYLHVKYISQSSVTSINMPPVVIGFLSDFAWLHFISHVNFQGNLRVFPFSPEEIGYQNAGQVELWRVNNPAVPSDKTLIAIAEKNAGDPYTIITGVTFEMDVQYGIGHTDAFYRDSDNLQAHGFWNTPLLTLLGSEYRRTQFNNLNSHASNTYAFRRIDFINTDDSLFSDTPTALARDIAIAATHDEQAPENIEGYDKIILFDDIISG